MNKLKQNYNPHGHKNEVCTGAEVKQVQKAGRMYYLEP